MTNKPISVAPVVGGVYDQYARTRNGISKRPVRQVRVLALNNGQAHVVALNGPVAGTDYEIALDLLRG